MLMGHRWMVVWMILLATTVAFQRRTKEATKLREKFEELRREDEKNRFNVE